jgi:hypothetical protein
VGSAMIPERHTAALHGVGTIKYDRAFRRFRRAIWLKP